MPACSVASAFPKAFFGERAGDSNGTTPSTSDVVGESRVVLVRG